MYRRLAAVVMAGLLVSLAGCGFITGEEALTFSSDPATVEDDAVSGTGYEEASVSPLVVTQNFSVADQTRQVNVTNQLARYERRVDLGLLGSVRAGVFATFSSPEVSVLSQSFNPISRLSIREILDRFESQYSGLEVGQQVGNRTVQTLDQQVAFERFEGTASLTATQVDVYVHAAKFKHDGDYIVVVGIYPQRLSGEDETMVTLLEGLEHDD